MDDNIRHDTGQAFFAYRMRQQEAETGRRNLPAYERARLALRLKPVIAGRAKEQQARTAENRVSQISAKQAIDTRQELAKAAGVSHDTIAKVKKSSQKPMRT